MEQQEKIIILDYGIYSHRAIFASTKNKAVPVEYICANMILSDLLKIDVNPQDEIFIACDYGHSWRKQFDQNYKANRKEGREKHTDINWTEMFSRINSLLQTLDYATDWHVFKEDGIEADDWMAQATKLFPDKLVVLVSYDKDLEQLLVRPNVKIFSPMSKKYKIVANPYSVLASKIDKEPSDNLTNPVLNETDFDRRDLIVNLLELPEFVTSKIDAKLLYDSQIPKEEHVDEFPFDSLRRKYCGLYNDKTKIVTLEASMKKKRTRKKKDVS
jgi:hypothetical protein